MPGKTNTLFAWPITRRRPSTVVTASNGEPVATIARPSVQARMSAGVASTADVGLDSGSTIGRSPGSSPSTIARMTASLNVPATPVAPTRIVGRRSRIVSSRSGVCDRRDPGGSDDSVAPGQRPGPTSTHRDRSARRGRAPSCRRARSPRAHATRAALHRASPGEAGGRSRSRPPRRPRARSGHPRASVPSRAGPRVRPPRRPPPCPEMSSLNDGTRSR